MRRLLFFVGVVVVGGVGIHLTNGREDRLQTPLWRELVGENSSRDEQASVTVVEFCSFDCSFCRWFADSVRAVVSEFGGQVRLVRRQFVHPDNMVAYRLAQGEKCAAQAGREAEFGKVAFGIQLRRVEYTDLRELAEAAEVPDVREFLACIDEASTNAALVRDNVLAGRAGVLMTPTIFVGGTRISGAVSNDRLREIIRSGLASGR